MKINKKLLSQFTEETNLIPTYVKDGATYHTLKYVNWLESKVENGNTCDKCETNKATECYCESCLTEIVNRGN